MKRVLLLLLAFGLCLNFSAFAQERVLTGKVISGEDDSSPLPGVNVIVKGDPTTGTITDIDGNFRLSVPASATTLVFSYIGFQAQEVAIGNKTTFNITLQGDDEILEEVVVTGYGVQEKRSISGSIASVKGDVIENLPLQSFDRALQGRAAGVQVTATSGAPGGAINVRIRGIGTITGSTEPLYIIDGVQVTSGNTGSFSSTNALNSLNPNDIESIEVLKDAAAAAIYGAQAANGVVLITTKRGKQGKTKVSFTAQVGEIRPIRLLDAMNTEQFKTIRTEALTNRFGANYDPGGQGRTTAQYVQDLMGNEYTDWQEVVYRVGNNQLYDLTVSGGDEKTKFYVAGSYNMQEGHVIGNDFERATLRANFDHKFNDKFSIEQKIGLTNTTQNGVVGDNSFGAFINSPHFASVFIAPYAPVYGEGDEGFNEDIPAPFGYNVAQMVQLDQNRTNTVQVIGNIAVNYDIMPGLRFRAFAGVDHGDMTERQWRDPRINQYASFNGRRSMRNRRITNFNANATLNYNKTFGGVHNVSALVGTEYRNQDWETITTTAEGFSNFNLNTLASGANPTAASSFNTSWNIASAFVNAQYNFNQKYFVTGTVRTDGSSRFGADNRWGVFYSTSAAWRISEESFMDNIGMIEDLKIRASYGETGNSLLDPNGTDNFQANAAWGAVGFYEGENGNAPTELGNNVLGWEVSRTINLGLDYALFNGRISGAVDVYRRRSEDLLLDRPLPTDTGWGSIITNVGTVENRGIEIELQTVNIDKGDFSWRTNFNISFQENEVLELFDGEDRIGNTIQVGQPLNLLWYPEYAGVNPANGRPMWFDSLGNTTYNLQARDSKIVGDLIPDFFGGLTNTITWKGFSLDVFFQYEYGVDVLNNLDFFHEASGGYVWNQNANQLDRWTTPGQITSVPRAYDGVALPNTTRGNQFSSRQVEDASYIRLKQLTLAYSLPANLVSKAGLGNVKVFMQGINLWTMTEFSGWDPELITTSLNQYPQGKIYSAGISIGL